MHVQPPTNHPRGPQPPKRLPILGLVLFVIAAGIVVLAAIGTSKLIASNHASAIPEIKSGITGYCLDDYFDSAATNAAVDSWGCNGTAAQEWVVSGTAIKHNGTFCLAVKNNGTSSGDAIVANTCNGGSGQVWVSAIDGYENPSSARCLDVPDNHTHRQLVLASCSGLTQPDEAWMPATWSKAADKTGASLACSGTRGQEVACYAAKQWVAWRSGSQSHETLLNQYTDGNSYEEWCADFVSYVYKEAGYPFLWGERDGWDEYLAYNIPNMGYTYHSPAGYTPQPGDVAYFDYPGGHVEIVAIGGPKPIFIYGDSGTTDPSTNNGEMTENTITDDGSKGQLTYYLSPN